MAFLQVPRLLLEGHPGQESRRLLAVFLRAQLLQEGLFPPRPAVRAGRGPLARRPVLQVSPKRQVAQVQVQAVRRRGSEAWESAQGLLWNVASNGATHRRWQHSALQQKQLLPLR
jgi:hypothetical protein